MYLNWRTPLSIAARLGESGGQMVAFQRRCAQIHYGASRFGEAVPRHSARQIQVLASGVQMAVERHCYGIQLR